MISHNAVLSYGLSEYGVAIRIRHTLEPLKEWRLRSDDRHAAIDSLHRFCPLPWLEPRPEQWTALNLRLLDIFTDHLGRIADPESWGTTTAFDPLVAVPGGAWCSSGHRSYRPPWRD